MSELLSRKYSDFRRSYSNLKKYCQIANETEDRRILVIHTFEITFELWWKFLQKYIEDYGTIESYGPASAIRQACLYNIIEDGDVYMSMLKDRNLVTHTYQESIAKEIEKRIINQHFLVFSTFVKEMDKTYGE